MSVTRREFLAISGAVGAGLALTALGLDMGPAKAYAAELKIDKMKTAKQSTSICPYCAVGCGLICSADTKAKKIINIEGDPDHPTNEGALCAKGASVFQTTGNNTNRLTKVLYRAPGSDKWQEKSWDWAIGEIAKKVKIPQPAVSQHLKVLRSADLVEDDRQGQEVQYSVNVYYMASLLKKLAINLPNKHNK